MYLATFHTHFGAMSFQKSMQKRGDATAAMMPVPRQLSSSCGVCVRFSLAFEPVWADEDLEGVYLEGQGGYTAVFHNEE